MNFPKGLLFKFRKKEIIVNTDSRQFKRAERIFNSLFPKKDGTPTHEPVLIVTKGKWFSKDSKKYIVVLLKNVKWSKMYQSILLDPYMKQIISKKTPFTIEATYIQEQIPLCVNKIQQITVVVGVTEIAQYLKKEHLGDTIKKQILIVKYLMAGMGRLYKEDPTFNCEEISFM